MSYKPLGEIMVTMKKAPKRYADYCLSPPVKAAARPSRHPFMRETSHQELLFGRPRQYLNWNRI